METQRELELIKKIEEMAATISDLEKQVAMLSARIEQLLEENKELREKLNKNSRNSSKPPSSDGLKKPSPTNLREKTGKKVGGQDGHKGSNLNIKATPDKIVKHMPRICEGCAFRERCEGKACVQEARTVIDAVVKISVTEHQKMVVNHCPMRNAEKMAGEFPEEIKATIQYGNNLKALAVALNTVGTVSINRIHEILTSVFGIPISTGTICNMVKSCAEKIRNVASSIQEKIISSPVVHFDETGIRIDGKTYWVHISSTGMYTYLSIHSKRGIVGMEGNGVLPKFTGIAVHDCWKPYWRFEDPQHAVCCAHILRELKGIEENYPEQKWASDFKSLLMDMEKTKKEALSEGKTEGDDAIKKEFSNRYGEILTEAFKTNPIKFDPQNQKRKKKGKILALAERLANYKEAVCRFFNNFAVPFTNNLAERDLRMTKVKDKVSGCFRTLTGAESFLLIMSYVGTAKKHGINSHQAILHAIEGTPDFIFSG